MRISIDVRDQLLDVRNEIVRPVLAHLEKAEPRLSGLTPERLLLGTSLVESWAHNIRQDPRGPARGLWQMEKGTHDWLRDEVLNRWSDIRQTVLELEGKSPSGYEALAGNHYYACAMARLRYWVVPKALPQPGDIQGMAQYWKQFYNTPLGAGHMRDFVNRYQVYIVPLY